MKKHTPLTRLPLLTLTTCLSLMGCSSFHSMIERDDTNDRTMAQIRGPRHAPELNPGSKGDMKQIANAAAASAIPRMPKGNRETDPYDYYDMEGKEADSDESAASGAAPEPTPSVENGKFVGPHAKKDDSMFSMFDRQQPQTGGEARKPLPMNGMARQQAMAQQNELPPASASMAAPTIVPAPEPVVTSNEQQSASLPTTMEPVTSKKPAKPAKPEKSASKGTVKDLNKELNKEEAPKAEKPAAPAPEAATDSLPSASPLFLAFPTPPAPPQAAPKPAPLPPLPVPDAQPQTDQPQDKDSSENESHGSFFSRVAHSFDRDPPKVVDDAEANDNAAYPSLSSVPPVPAQFETIKAGQQQDMQDLKQQYDAAQEGKQQLDAEPTTLKPLLSTPSAAASASAASANQ